MAKLINNAEISLSAYKNKLKEIQSLRNEKNVLLTKMRKFTLTQDRRISYSGDKLIITDKFKNSSGVTTISKVVDLFDNIKEIKKETGEITHKFPKSKLMNLKRIIELTDKVMRLGKDPFHKPPMPALDGEGRPTGQQAVDDNKNLLFGDSIIEELTNQIVELLTESGNSKKK